MRLYILSIAGVVLISAVISIIAPSGKTGKLVKGMTKFFIIVVLIAPFVSIFRGEGFVFASSEIGEDRAYLERSATLMAEADAREIKAWLSEEYGIKADAVVSRSPVDFSHVKIVVKIRDFGIFGQDGHIDIVAELETLLRERYGCESEVS